MATAVAERISNGLTMRILEPQLRKDLRRSILDAIGVGARFQCRAIPGSIFRSIVSEAIGVHARRLENLLIDCESVDQTRFDAATSKDYYWAVRFAVSRAVAAIQGSLAELLALGPTVALVRELKAARRIPEATQIWVGDSIFTPRLTGEGLAKSADVHLLTMASTRSSAALVGVVEAKSYRCSKAEIAEQIESHLARASRALVTQPYGGARVRYAVRLAANPVRICVIPASWRLSRRFRFQSRGDRQFLTMDPPGFSVATMAVANSPDEWRIVLRWSKEALADAAFEVFLWCLGRLGEGLYSHRPSPWPEMSSAEAGQNAVKMALYYAIENISDSKTRAQAIKLYNVLGFGFALGANFRGPDGRPKMLWHEDLEEILQNGRTRKGAYIHGMSPNNGVQATPKIGRT